MNFSQEVVQEFQVSSVNFDLSTDITSVGSVNVVTRDGSNQFHGAGLLLFPRSQYGRLSRLGARSSRDQILSLRGAILDSGWAGR